MNEIIGKRRKENGKKPLTVMMAWRGKAPLLPLETKFLGWPFALLQLSLALIRGS